MVEVDEQQQQQKMGHWSISCCLYNQDLSYVCISIINMANVWKFHRRRVFTQFNFTVTNINVKRDLGARKAKGHMRWMNG